MEQDYAFTEAIDVLTSLPAGGNEKLYAYSVKASYGFFVSMHDSGVSKSVHFVNAQTGNREPVPAKAIKAKDYVIVSGIIYEKNEFRDLRLLIPKNDTP